MIDDNGVKAKPLRFGERLDAGGPAIDRHKQPRAARGKGADGFDVRTIALKNAIRNVDQGFDPSNAQEAREQRRRGCAVHIVVAEDRDLFAAHDRVGDTARRRLHIDDHIGVRHQPLDGGIEIGLDGVNLHVAPRQDASKHFRHAMALSYGERTRIAAIVKAVAPRPPSRRTLDAEEVAVRTQDRHAASPNAKKVTYYTDSREYGDGEASCSTA